MSAYTARHAIVTGVCLPYVKPFCAPGVEGGTMTSAHPIRDGDIVCRLSARAFRGRMVSRPPSSGNVALGLQASRRLFHHSSLVQGPLRNPPLPTLAVQAIYAV